MIRSSAAVAVVLAGGAVAGSVLGCVELGFASVVEGDLPVLLGWFVGVGFDQVVVVRAQQHPVGQVGPAALVPGLLGVVGFAV